MNLIATFIILQNEPLISHVQHDAEVTVPDQGQCLQCVSIYLQKQFPMIEVTCTRVLKLRLIYVYVFISLLFACLKHFHLPHNYNSHSDILENSFRIRLHFLFCLLDITSLDSNSLLHVLITDYFNVYSVWKYDNLHTPSWWDFCSRSLFTICKLVLLRISNVLDHTMLLVIVLK